MNNWDTRIMSLFCLFGPLILELSKGEGWFKNQMRREKNICVLEGAKYPKAAENPALPFPAIPMPTVLTDRPVLSAKTWKKQEQLFLPWCQSPNNFSSDSGFTTRPYFCLTFDFWAFFCLFLGDRGVPMEERIGIPSPPFFKIWRNTTFLLSYSSLTDVSDFPQLFRKPWDVGMWERGRQALLGFPLHQETAEQPLARALLSPRASLPPWLLSLGNSLCCPSPSPLRQPLRPSPPPLSPCSLHMQMPEPTCPEHWIAGPKPRGMGVLER